MAKDRDLSTLLDALVAGIAANFLAGVPVLIGIVAALYFGKPPTTSSDAYSACFHSDASNYLQIVRFGYSFDPARASNVAFFPAYPMVARWLSAATAMSPEEGMLLTAYLALVGTFISLANWTHLRWSNANARQ